jgi:hypothetical protein
MYIASPGYPPDPHGGPEQTAAVEALQRPQTVGGGPDPAPEQHMVQSTPSGGPALAADTGSSGTAFAASLAAVH